MTFTERIARLERMAAELRGMADVIADEAARMTLAAGRFSQRRGQRPAAKHE